MRGAGDPLHGVRVLDASRVLAGPLAAQLLADLGADVLKVEPPEGDPTRGWGPPFERGQAAYFRCANRGKRSIRLDLHREDHRRRLEALLAEADVFLENYLPGQAERFGLEPAALVERYPRLVVGSVRAFASDTDASRRAGFDLLMQAEAGWMAVTGDPEGRPTKVGFALVDVVAALHLAAGVEALLLRRERTGRGGRIEVPLIEAALAGLVNVAAGALASGQEPGRLGNRHPHIVPYGVFETRDGPIAVACGTDVQFARLYEEWEGRPLCGRRSAWRTNEGRLRDREAVERWLAGHLERVEREEALSRLGRARVPAGPVRGVLEALRARPGAWHRSLARLDDGTEALAPPLLVDGRRAFRSTPPPERPRGG